MLRSSVLVPLLAVGMAERTAESSLSTKGCIVQDGVLIGNASIEERSSVIGY